MDNEDGLPRETERNRLRDATGPVRLGKDSDPRPAGASGPNRPDSDSEPPSAGVGEPAGTAGATEPNRLGDDCEAARPGSDSDPVRLTGEGDPGRLTRASEENRVTRFLADNPEWLSMQAGLYGRLSPPRRVHGETLADHMAAMIEAARRQAADMTAHAETVLQAGRAASGLAERVRESVLALIRSADIGEWVADDLPRLLGIDTALLCVEGPASGVCGSLMARSMPRGMVASLLGRGDVLVRVAPGNAAVLHGEAASLAAHDALLRVPVAGLPPMLLALGSRDAHVLQDGLPASMTGGAAGSGGAASLAFLGAALAARIETPA